MTDARDHTPRTFWADRWRFARERTGQWLMPAVRAFFSGWIGLTLPLVLGGFLFGAAFVFAEMQAYLAGIFAVTAILSFALLAGTSVFVFHYLTAPAAMWKRDQRRIADLQTLLVPSLRLEFSEHDCRTWVPVGGVQESIGGKRWPHTKGTSEHILVRCVNGSEARIDEVELYAALLDFSPEWQDDMAPLRFLDPVRIRPLSDDVDILNMPAHGERRFSVLVRASDYDPPRLNGRALALTYERQFEKPGSYEIGIEAHGRNTSAAKVVLIVELRTKEFADAMGGKHPRYDIISVRQKED